MSRPSLQLFNQTVNSRRGPPGVIAPGSATLPTAAASAVASPMRPNTMPTAEMPICAQMALPLKITRPWNGLEGRRGAWRQGRQAGRQARKALAHRETAGLPRPQRVLGFPRTTPYNRFRGLKSRQKAHENYQAVRGRPRTQAIRGWPGLPH